VSRAAQEHGVDLSALFNFGLFNKPSDADAAELRGNEAPKRAAHSAERSSSAVYNYNLSVCHGFLLCNIGSLSNMSANGSKKRKST
jgi:hypothetical protein